jgi:hypothetical protein
MKYAAIVAEDLGMELDTELLKRLVYGVIETHDEELDCDECFEQLDRFVELELAGKSASQALPLVENHLRLCTDCREEYQALLDAVRHLADTQS